jgi:small subunit ribosomal protein S17
MTTETEAPKKRRTLVGTVVSDKMDKTVTIEVRRTVKHARYKKYMSRTKTYHAHDEKNECKVGDIVVMEESRPLSATKRWRVIERRAGSVAEPLPETVG